MYSALDTWSVGGDHGHSKNYTIMKIDLYNNHDAFIKESKQNIDIDQWCRQVGLDRKKIEQHPRIEDIRVLIDIRAYKTWFNRKDTQVFKHIWHQVYEHECPLTAYHRRKLDQIIVSVEYTQQHMKKRVMMMSKKGPSLDKFN